MEIDRLNFEIFWNPNADLNDEMMQSVLPGTYKIPETVNFRLRVVCKSVSDKNNLFERLLMSKKAALPERNTFVNGKTH
jgi:hypothetical protein